MGAVPKSGVCRDRLGCGVLTRVPGTLSLWAHGPHVCMPPGPCGGGGFGGRFPWLPLFHSRDPQGQRAGPWQGYPHCHPNLGTGSGYKLGASVSPHPERGPLWFSRSAGELTAPRWERAPSSPHSQPRSARARNSSCKALAPSWGSPFSLPLSPGAPACAPACCLSPG